MRYSYVYHEGFRDTLALWGRYSDHPRLGVTLDHNVSYESRMHLLFDPDPFVLVREHFEPQYPTLLILSRLR